MTSTSLLQDAFAHNVWATEVVIDACAGLTHEQLVAEAPGTYGHGGLTQAGAPAVAGA